MESFIELNPIEIDNFLPSIKENLESQEESLQLKSIGSIMKCFLNAESGGRDILLRKFKRFGVMDVLLNLLHALDDRLSPCILDFLILAKDYPSFYIGETPTLAIKVLIRVSLCLVKSIAEEVPMLEQCILTMSGILKNRLVFNESLEIIHKEILPFVKIVCDRQNDRNLRLVVIKLLNIILENTPVGSDIQLLDCCLEAIKFTKELIGCKEDVSVKAGLMTLCATCAFGSCHCISERNPNNNATIAKIQRCRESLGQAIYSSITNTIVPLAMQLDLDNEDRVEFQSAFVASLRAVYNLEYCNHNYLSNQLAANGYLKCFLRLSVECPINLRESICCLLPRVLFSLEQMSTPPGESPEECCELSNQTNQLASLPRNPTDWFFPGRTDIESQSLLLTLIYHHCLGTNEAEVISYEFFAAKLVVLQQQPQASWRALRVLWFLFAVVYTRQEVPRSEPHYSLAIATLTSALSQSNLSSCYTHHIDLMRFCLECDKFPIDLQRAVIWLWLIQCNGDVKPLLQLNSDKILQHCLFIALYADHQDKRLTSFVKIIRELLNQNNVIDVTKNTWENLPELLAYYHPNKNECLKLLLELTIDSNTSTLPTRTIQDTADAIVKILLRTPADTEVRTLLIAQAQILLDQTPTVLQTYVSTRDFLLSLWNDAFTLGDSELTVTCLKLLVLIVQRQQETHIKFEQPAEVEVENFTDLLYRGQNIAEVRYNVLKLLLEFLKESDEELPIRLAKIDPNSEEAEAIFYLHNVLHDVSAKIDSGQTGLVYQCLIKLFDFCHQRAEKLMHALCTDLSVCNVIDCIFDMNQVSSNFLLFVACWLRYHATYCTEGEWRLALLDKTRYEETVDRIEAYINKQDNERSDDAYCELRSALSLTPQE